MRDTKALRHARENEANPYARRFVARGWTRTVTVCDVPRLFLRLPEFAGWTRERHEQISRDYLAQAIAAARVQGDTLRRYEGLYGTEGPLIAGGIRDGWPEWAKDIIRDGWQRINTFTDQSLAHWQAAGKRVATWRDLRDSLETDC